MMNQPDAEYWLAVAAQWIQSKSQAQMNFPFQSPFPQNIPEAPQISNIDATTRDNLVEADMDIDEDVKEEEQEEPAQIWTNWQANNEPKQPESIKEPNNQHPTIHIISNTQIVKPSTKKRNNRFSGHRNSRFAQCPVPPIIGEITESTHSEDMVLDSDDDEHISPSMMEAQKRKKLPVWIREGLERIEREKKLEEQRLQREKEHQDEEENRKKIMEEALKELEREKISKSKYDSESEEETNQDDVTPEKTESPPSAQVIVQDEEEAFEKMMLLVRKTLTEILLEVTDEKIHEISSETLSKYRKKASSVTSNRTVTNSLGLGVYEDSSDDSEAEDSERANDQTDDWESETVLKERIRVKSIAFEQRAREIKERLAKINEIEQERFNKKPKDTREHVLRHESDGDKIQKSRSRKNDGEEKYEQINSVSSYVSNSRQRDKKKTRFNDPKERTSNLLLTHVQVGHQSMMDTPKSSGDNGSVVSTPQLLSNESQVSIKREKDKKRDDSSSSTSSSSSGRHKKHKKHKKSSKRSKKSSKKRERSRSRSRDYDRDKRKAYKSERRSIESKSSIRSSESRRRSRSRSRSRDRHRSRKY